MPTQRTILRPAGRRLHVVSYGPEDGRPVLYCHGTPSAHNEWEVFGDEALLHRHGVRLIAPDRPGLGRSDFQPRRQIGDWPADAAAVLDDFGIGRFGVLGYSGGGAYATATALALAPRVEALVLVAPVTHAAPGMEQGLDPQGLKIKELARTRPFVARCVLALAMGLPARVAPAELKKQMLKVMPPVDAEALHQDGRLDRFVDVVREGMRQGGRGPAQDMGLMVGPWDFALAPADFPVAIWQGEADSFGARPAMARYLAERLGARRLELTDDGHISIMSRNLEAILGALAGAPGN